MVQYRTNILVYGHIETKLIIEVINLDVTRTNDVDFRPIVLHVRHYSIIVPEYEPSTATTTNICLPTVPYHSKAVNQVRHLRSSEPHQNPLVYKHTCLLFFLIYFCLQIRLLFIISMGFCYY